MQIPKTLDGLDEAAFLIWLRRYGALIHKTIPNSSCIVKFEVFNKNKLYASGGAIWTYDGLVEYQGCALLNYASFLMRGRPILDLNNMYQVKNPPAQFFVGSSASRKKRTFRHRMLQRDGRICFYCGYEMDIDDITLEHLVPRSKGGRTTSENIVLAHGYCNNRAGTLCLEDKLALRGKIMPPHIAWKVNRYGTHS
jgi:hypothetical protein